MVRYRSAATQADASPAPHQARYFLSCLLLLALAAIAGCSSAAGRGEPSKPSGHSQQAAGSASSTTPAAGGHATPTDPVSSTRSRELAAERAWAGSKTAFYQAALIGDPTYPPLLATLVRGGPVYVHSIAYLTGLASQGLRGPPTWRVGNARVAQMTADRARVEGCLYDTGSVWKASGAPAPASLGGGAGLTASDALLVLEAGRWLVFEDAVSAVSSPKEPGPCHGF